MFLSALPLIINQERPLQGKIEIIRRCDNEYKDFFLFIAGTMVFRIIV